MAIPLWLSELLLWSLSYWRGYIWRGDLTEGFLRYRIGGLIFGGAYFRNFTVIQLVKSLPIHIPEA